MKREAIEELVANEVLKIIESTELELVDVEYVRERDWYLRVFLDKPGGIDLDDCQMVSEKIGNFLDESDPIKENYLLEVSSPGLDRVLKKDKDFVKYQDYKVDLQLFKPIDGSKQYTGNLKSFTASTVTIVIEEKEHIFERNEIAQIRLHVDF